MISQNFPPCPEEGLLPSLPPAADRVLVDSEGIDDVACHDGIGDSAIRPLIQVQCLDSDEAGIDCVWALVQHHLIIWLLEHRSVVILIHDSHVHVGGGLERRMWSDALVRRSERSRLIQPAVFLG